MRRRHRSVHRSIALCLALAAALAAGPASAKDLGVRGATWPIAEPDLLDAIATRLEALRDAGAFARWAAKARTRARAHLEAPPRVPGIIPATEHRTRRLDPAVTVARDLTAPDGTVLAQGRDPGQSARPRPALAPAAAGRRHPRRGGRVGAPVPEARDARAPRRAPARARAHPPAPRLLRPGRGHRPEIRDSGHPLGGGARRAVAARHRGGARRLRPRPAGGRPMTLNTERPTVSSTSRPQPHDRRRPRCWM